MSKRFSKGNKRKKVTEGTKENLNTVINELLIITGRKTIHKENNSKDITYAFKNADVHIAALGVVLPNIDLIWVNSGSKNAFIKIKQGRRNIIRSLITGAIFLSLLTIGGATLAIIFIDHWVKYVILLLTASLLLLISTNFNKLVLVPILRKRDALIPAVYKKECELLNIFIAELIDFRRKS